MQVVHVQADEEFLPVPPQSIDRKYHLRCKQQCAGTSRCRGPQHFVPAHQGVAGAQRLGVLENGVIIFRRC